MSMGSEKPYGDMIAMVKRKISMSGVFSEIDFAALWINSHRAWLSTPLLPHGAAIPAQDFGSTLTGWLRWLPIGRQPAVAEGTSPASTRKDKIVRAQVAEAVEGTCSHRPQAGCGR